MTPKSVKKKLKQPSFAAGVNRDEVRAGAEELGVDFDEHVAFVIAAMEERADELGLGARVPARQRQRRQRHAPPWPSRPGGRPSRSASGMRCSPRWRTSTSVHVAQRRAAVGAGVRASP